MDAENNFGRWLSGLHDSISLPKSHAIQFRLNPKLSHGIQKSGSRISRLLLDVMPTTSQGKAEM